MAHVPPTHVSANPLVAFFQYVWSSTYTVAKGLKVTGYNALRRPRVTVPYPLQQIEISLRTRARHRILTDEQGESLCIACGQCQRTCPDHCIVVTRKKVTVTTPEGEEKQANRADTFLIDLARCMYCNLCAEVCPANCLHLTRDFSYTEGDVRALTIDLAGLLRPGPVSEYEAVQAVEAQRAPDRGEEA